MDDLNVKLLSATTNQQSEAEASQLNAKVEHVAEASVTSCALSMHEHPAAQPSSNPSASSSDPEPVSADPHQRLGTASSFAVSKQSSAPKP